MGRPSMQLAWARARRCMNGERLELSGLNSFPAMRPTATSRPRRISIRTTSSNVHAIRSVNTVSDAYAIFGPSQIRSAALHGRMMQDA